MFIPIPNVLIFFHHLFKSKQKKSTMNKNEILDDWARRSNIDQQIISLLPKKRLCNLVNQVLEKEEFDCNEFGTEDDPSILAISQINQKEENLEIQQKKENEKVEIQQEEGTEKEKEIEKEKKIQKEEEIQQKVDSLPSSSGDQLWKIEKENDLRNGNVLVEWSPSCVSSADFQKYRQEYEISDYKKNMALVAWKNTLVSKKEIDSLLSKNEINGRNVKKVLEKSENSFLVQWEPSCINQKQLKSMQNEIENILQEDAVYIKWKDQVLAKKSIIEESLFAKEDSKEKEAISNLSLSLNNARDYDSELEKIKPKLMQERDVNFNAKKLLDLGRNLNAAKCFSRTEWLRDRKLRQDIEKFVCVDNLGEGDCMYCALAPILREFFPNLFIGVTNTEENNAIQLRKILATKLPKTVKDVYRFLHNYMDSLNNSAAQRKLREQIEKKYAAFLQSSSDVARLPILQETIDKIRLEMLTKNYWAHREDFLFVSELVAPFVHIVLMESKYGIDVPPFNILYDTDYVTRPETKFIFLYHIGQHFVRLQLKEDGKFAFSKEEFGNFFPEIAKLYYNQTKTTNLNLNLAKLFQFIRENKPELAIRDDYNYFYSTLLGFNSNNLEQSIADVFPKVKDDFDKLNESDKTLLMDEILRRLPKEDSIPLTLGFTNSDTIKDDNLTQEDMQEWIKDIKKSTNTESPKNKKILDVQDETEEEKSRKKDQEKQIEIFKKEVLKNIKDYPFNLLPCLPLTNVEQEAYQKILQKARENPNLQFNLVFDYPIIGKTILKLQDSEWLNDEIINAYAKLVVSKHNLLYESQYQTISSQLYNENNKKKELNIQENPTKIFWPINANKNHWFLAVIDFLQRKIIFYDSLCSKEDKKSAHENNIKFLIPQARDFSVSTAETNQQKNSSDCGPFTLAFIMQNLDPSARVIQENIPCFRKRILLELVNFKDVYSK